MGIPPIVTVGPSHKAISFLPVVSVLPSGNLAGLLVAVFVDPERAAWSLSDGSLGWQVGPGSSYLTCLPVGICTGLWWACLHFSLL